jgi:hypothetical protein
LDKKGLEVTDRLEQIFMPYATGRREQLRGRNGRLVHYTSAENAIKILYSKQVWMRNAKCMADYMELSHGHALLLQFFQHQDKRDSFYKALNKCHPNVGEEALLLFDQWWRNNIEYEIYVTSVSEHDDSEDTHGRLSMWRAFGRVPSARAAIVMKLPGPDAASGLRVALSPVAYFDYPNVEKQLKKVINNIKKHQEFLGSLPKDRVKDIVFITILNAAVSLKHEGFREEREWRIIYVPKIHQSKMITFNTEVIEGVPQLVYKIPLQDSPDEDIVGVKIPSIVDRVIIGPTAYPIPMAHAFVLALHNAGVTDAGSRVVISNIPLRP